MKNLRRTSRNIDCVNVEYDIDGNPKMVPEQIDNLWTGNWIIEQEHFVEKKASLVDTWGRAEQEHFGVEFEADKILISNNPNCPIIETTKLFIDTPYTDINDTGDFRVDKIRRTPNKSAYALKKI